MFASDVKLSIAEYQYNVCAVCNE